MRSFATNNWLAVAVALAAMGIASGAFAKRNDQNPNQNAPPARDQGQDAAAKIGQLGAGMLNQMAAEGMMQMSQSEIQLANFALQHTQNEEVRRFAQTLIKDHVDLNKQLERFASEEVRALWGNESRAPAGGAAAPGPNAQAPQPGAETAAQPATQPGAQPGRGNEAGPMPGSLFQIRQDISDQVVASIERELGKFQGADFDRAFLGQQFWGHVVFVASATAGGKHVSGELKQVVDQGAKTAEKHLEDCRKLIRDLSANVARGTETTPRR
jgi:predicted outer membrane protein